MSTPPQAVITITQQPTSTTISGSGSPPYTGSVTVEATVTRGVLTYQWQLLQNDNTWVDLNAVLFSNGSFSGATSQTATKTFINPPSAGIASTMRCVLSALGAASVISETVTITTV